MGGHDNLKCDFSKLTLEQPTLLSYTLDHQIQTNEEGIWKFEFDESTVTGIILTKSGMTFDNFECDNEVCTSKTPVGEGKWTVKVEVLMDRYPLITSLQVGGEENFICESENCK